MRQCHYLDKIENALSTKKFLIVIYTLSFLTIYNTCFAQYRIMPLGDSITRGMGDAPPYTGYRSHLFDYLVTENINFDFVGSLNDGDPAVFDTDHEGHGGWKAQDIDANIESWLNSTPPDVVLLDIGTNDVGASEPNDQTIIEIENIIDKIFYFNSQIKILICTLVRRAGDWEWGYYRTEELNVLISNLYNQKLARGYEIFLVNQNAAFKANANWEQDYMADNVHPNDRGYRVMAQTFFDVLRNILSPVLYTISGNVLYYANNNPIDNVLLSLSGGTALAYTTGLSGYYEFNGLKKNNNYFVQLAKTKILRTQNNVITMYNAALTLRHAVGVETLSSVKQIAADVDKDGQVLAFDAAIIARYVVELPPMDNDYVGEWIFNPGERNYQFLSSDQKGQDYSGILLGDVDGAWQQQGNLNKSRKSNFAWISEIEGKPGEYISVPVSIFEDSLLSLSVDLEYPADMLTFDSIEEPSTNYTVELISNIFRNKIKLGLFSPDFLSIEGELFRLRFKIKDDASGKRIISLNRLQINNYSVESSIAELNVTAEPLDHFAFKVGDNYPNPFNPATTIPYEIRDAGHVNISIYNVLGQQIKTLINEYHGSGSYRINWDGNDESGTRVANGIYVYQLKYNNQTVSKTMLMLE